MSSNLLSSKLAQMGLAQMVKRKYQTKPARKIFNPNAENHYGRDFAAKGYISPPRAANKKIITGPEITIRAKQVS